MSLSTRTSNAEHTRGVIAKAIVGGMLAILPSCQIPNLRHAEAVPELPGVYKEPQQIAVPSSPADGTQGSEDLPPPPAVAPGATDVNLAGEPVSFENSADLGVNEFYGDPVLVDLIFRSLADNRELKVLEQEVQVAANDILARRGAYLPFVTFGARAGAEKPSLYTPYGAAEDQLLFPGGRNFPDPLGNFLGSFNLSWRLDPWRQLRNARDAAAQRYFAALEKRGYFATTLVAGVAENYYTLMALDKRIEVLDRTIELQERSLDMAKAKKEAGKGSELAVQRFLAEVRKNQSEKLIVRQEIIETENRVNFLINRYPEPVQRDASGFFELTIHALNAGVPSQLLQNRPDIRQAERELAAAGIDVRVARANFFPQINITAGIGLEAFNPKYLFKTPDAMIANAVGDLVAPVINKKAIQAEYLTANAKQLEAVYEYQRIVLNAFTEVFNRMNMAENFRRSAEIKQLQLESLEASVDAAGKLFQAARVEYIEVLFAQRDLLEARTALIETKKQQLSAIVNAYQALGGGARNVGGIALASLAVPKLLPSHHGSKNCAR